MEFRDKIKALRLQHELTLEDVAKSVGVSKPTVQRWESGEIANIRRDKIAKLAVALNTTPAYLMDWVDDPADTSPAAARIGVYGLVPAGVPLEAIEDILDWEEIPLSMCSGGREYFGLQVKGDSMWPDYLEGDVVIVQKTPVCESGDDCVVYINGYDATLKRVKLGEDGSLTIIPRNQNYSPRTYSPEEVRDLPVSIAGVVVELRRKMRKAEG